MAAASASTATAGCIAKPKNRQNAGRAGLSTFVKSSSSQCRFHTRHARLSCAMLLQLRDCGQCCRTPARSRPHGIARAMAVSSVMIAVNRASARPRYYTWWRFSMPVARCAAGLQAEVWKGGTSSRADRFRIWYRLLRVNGDGIAAAFIASLTLHTRSRRGLTVAIWPSDNFRKIRAMNCTIYLDAGTSSVHLRCGPLPRASQREFSPIKTASRWRRRGRRTHRFPRNRR